MPKIADLLELDKAPNKTFPVQPEHVQFEEAGTSLQNVLRDLWRPSNEALVALTQPVFHEVQRTLREMLVLPVRQFQQMFSLEMLGLQRLQRHILGIVLLWDPVQAEKIATSRSGITFLKALAQDPDAPGDVRILARYYLVRRQTPSIHSGDYERLKAELLSRASAMDLTPTQQKRTPGQPRDAWREALQQAVALVGDDEDWLAAARREALLDLYNDAPPFLDTRRGGERIVMPRTVPLSAYQHPEHPPTSIDCADESSDAYAQLAELFALASEAERRALLDALHAFEEGRPLSPRTRQALSRLRKRLART